MDRARISVVGLGLLVEKVRDIVGLIVDLPVKAGVLCAHDQSQIQTWDRTQHLLPVALGYVVGMTHDCLWHSTTTAYALLDVATLQAITSCKSRRRHQEYLTFPTSVEASVPPRLAFVSSSITARRISTPRSNTGWQHALASGSLATRLMPLGSAKSESGSTLWPREPLGEASCGVSRAWLPRSTSSSTAATPEPDPSAGPRPPTPTSRK